ncbi:MAG: dependent oxidoreductase [Anaerocolumna sp.]|jgi:NADPH-dependent glutamate synthase beta subunit-like oxidoreductase|nr:dependent oxidoreductase [Anaerocolumna sp.]
MSKYKLEQPGNQNEKLQLLYNKFKQKIESYPVGVCPLTVQMSLLQTSKNQTCGKCVPCRDGLVQLEKLLQEIIDGNGTKNTLRELKVLAEYIRDNADCAIGYEPADSMLKGMELFKEEYLNHIIMHVCGEEIQQKVPCIAMCPSHVDIPGYLALIGEEDYAGAVNLIRKENPFPTACAMICEHPCEEHCRRSMIDSPLNIRGLKKFAVDQMAADLVPVPEVNVATGRKIAVVGGGPSGMTAAYFLALMGHKVIIYEENVKLGGMLRYGIPNYRFPKDRLDEDIRAILSTGNIDVKYNVTVGKEIAIQELYDNYDAVYIAIGAQAAKKLSLEGTNSSNVFSAVDMLRGVGYGNLPDYSGKRVVVIGGGNVAMDCARTAIRCKAEEVTIVYRRRQEDMTALATEVEGAIREGVELVTLQAPLRIEADDSGTCTALWIQPQIIGTYDRNGRPRPVNAKKSPNKIPCDIILIAIGQDIESEPFEQFGIPVDGNCFITTNQCEVKVKPGIFAGGDCVTGPATVIKAVGAGKTAAYAIDEYLGYHHKIISEVRIPDARPNHRMPTGRVNFTEREARVRKLDFLPVENEMSFEEAMQETSRCLRCDHYGCGVLEGGRD